MIKLIFFLLQLSKKLLVRYIKSLPDQDAYATVYSMGADMATEIDDFLKDFPEIFEESQSDLIEHPDQLHNRAIDWSYYPKD
jgi:hypothetical protein